MNQYENIKKQLKVFEELALNRKWDIYSELIIDKTANIHDIEEVEEIIGYKLPEEYKELFLIVSKKIDFAYSIEEEIPEEYNEIMGGEVSWNLDELVLRINDYKDWIEASTDLKYNDKESVEITKRIGVNKTPFIETANGDVLVIDNFTNELFYLDHEGGDFHGKRLGGSLKEFINIWSKIGFIGCEHWQFEKLYDFDEEKLLSLEHPKVQEWIKWLLDIKKNA